LISAGAAVHDRGRMSLSRRTLLTAASAAAAASAAPLVPGRGRAATVKAGAGRAVAVPAEVGRVFPAGPPAAIMLYTLAPAPLLGWPRPNGAP
jgi:iron complex transport system substrate-binding protein